LDVQSLQERKRKGGLGTLYGVVSDGLYVQLEGNLVETWGPGWMRAVRRASDVSYWASRGVKRWGGVFEPFLVAVLKGLGRDEMGRGLMLCVVEKWGMGVCGD